MRTLPIATLVLLAASLSGCAESRMIGEDSGVVDAPMDSLGRLDVLDDARFPDARLPDAPPSDVGPLPTSTPVDLLFVIDNSGSMREEQASLAAEIPRLMESLLTGVLPSRTFPAIEDIRVGFVSSDMGTGGYTIPTCNEPNYGDDGFLRRSGSAPGCIGADQPPYLEFRPGGSTDPDSIQCLIQLGTTGCGFEQQLDAMLKAVTPASSPTTFVNGTRGHGDASNGDFLRDDSLLVVVILSDEDDCSAANPAIFDRGSTTFTDPDLNLRCWRYGDPSIGAVHPIERYVDGLLALRSPDRLIFQVIAGVPLELAPGPGAEPDYEALVGDPAVRDPRMIEEPDPSMPTQLRASCNVPGRGVAYPPVRLVKVAQGLDSLGAMSLVTSICQDSFSTQLIEGIASHF